MLDFEADDGPEIGYAVKKDLSKDRPEVILNLSAFRPSVILTAFCVALTWLTLTTG